jgi:hypothetical protein
MSAEMPELWWSPTHGLIKSEDGLNWLLSTGPLVDPEDPDLLPEDAVRLMLVEDNGQHVISLTPESWTIKHPLACRPNLRDCPMTRAATMQLQYSLGEGDFYCHLDQHGVFMIGDEVS